MTITGDNPIWCPEDDTLGRAVLPVELGQERVRNIPPRSVQPGLHARSPPPAAERRQPGRYASPRSTVTISAMTATCPLSSGEKTIGSYSGLIGDSTIRAWRQSSSSEAAFSDE